MGFDDGLKALKAPFLFVFYLGLCPYLITKLIGAPPQTLIIKPPGAPPLSDNEAYWGSAPNPAKGASPFEYPRLGFQREKSLWLGFGGGVPVKSSPLLTIAAENGILNPDNFIFG